MVADDVAEPDGGAGISKCRRLTRKAACFWSLNSERLNSLSAAPFFRSGPSFSGTGAGAIVCAQPPVVTHRVIVEGPVNQPGLWGAQRSTRLTGTDWLTKWLRTVLIFALGLLI